MCTDNKKCSSETVKKTREEKIADGRQQLAERKASGEHEETGILMEKLGISEERQIEIGVEVNTRVQEYFEKSQDEGCFNSGASTLLLTDIPQTPGEGIAVGLLAEQLHSRISKAFSRNPLKELLESLGK